jgi:hypothetical protein
MGMPMPMPGAQAAMNPMPIPSMPLPGGQQMPQQPAMGMNPTGPFFFSLLAKLDLPNPSNHQLHLFLKIWEHLQTHGR